MAEPAALPGTVRVVVAVCTAPRQVDEHLVLLPVGSTVRDALAHVGVRLPPGAVVGIWGRKVGLQRAVAEGDRIECYRPLLVDPKVARRERFARQGARGTGLFAQRRPGAKPGY